MNYFNVHQIGSQWIAAIEAPMLIADLFSKKKNQMILLSLFNKADDPNQKLSAFLEKKALSKSDINFSSI